MYGSHRYLMAYLYYRHKYKLPTPKGTLAKLPRVTIQLPMFNEMYVAERLARRASRSIDYPRDRLEIQVLDDSTDETVRDRAREGRGAAAQRGFDVVYVHRDEPHGLQGRRARGRAEASPRASSSLVFDADFVPTPDFLTRPGPLLHRPEGRHGAGALGPPQPRLLAAHAGAGDHARRPLRHRAHRAQPLGPLLQLQRHRRHLAPRGHRRRRRLAARHAHRGHGPVATARSCAAGSSSTCPTSIAPAELPGAR